MELLVMRSKQKRTHKRNNSSRTKIVCTLGPKTEKKETLLQMIDAGMDVARLNFSHNSHEWHKMMFERVRALDPEMTIFFDLQGPKIRLGELSSEPIYLERGEQIILTADDIIGNKERVSVSLESLPQSVKKSNLIYINDGLVGLKVVKIAGNDVYCKIMSSGEIRSRKGVNIPNVELDIPILTEKDYEDLAFALDLEPDYIALSFVRKAEDILNLRSRIEEADKTIPIISKIEHAFAVKNFDKILAASDAIMVARGDLGIETSVEKLPILQKNIIQKCNLVGKPVVTATQMLESMVTNPRPSRAEASDVANAIYDGTDAVMLSAETAIGHYPVESIKMMNKIASFGKSDNGLDIHFFHQHTCGHCQVFRNHVLF
jgi:pyruvate kinase